MFKWLGVLRKVLPLVPKAKEVNWEQLVQTLTKGSWKTRLMAVFASLIFVICVVLKLFGVEVPSDLWGTGLFLLATATAWMVREDKVTSEDAGATPKGESTPSVQNDNAPVRIDPCDPPLDDLTPVKSDLSTPRIPTSTLNVQVEKRPENAADKKQKIEDELARRRGH